MHLNVQQRRTFYDTLGKLCKATYLVLAQHGSWTLRTSHHRYGHLHAQILQVQISCAQSCVTTLLTGCGADARGSFKCLQCLLRCQMRLYSVACIRGGAVMNGRKLLDMVLTASPMHLVRPCTKVF